MLAIYHAEPGSATARALGSLASPTATQAYPTASASDVPSHLIWAESRAAICDDQII
jgi:hypothetical protein